ncbi:MAG: RecQ family ATP-dependent DNA helicase [Pirellulaceae bacterium]|nr:RecQ family ATP-dependent DNA helicase [Pirellulaceae bacterium]
MNQPLASLDQALQRFGLREFRPGQREAIQAIAAGKDCLCVMPTGGGKSLCYQLPSLIRPGLTIVVSPLIALMKDQVDSLARNGIHAALINSTLSHSQQQQRLSDVAAGKYKLVYVAPERLRSPQFMEAIRATPIQLLAVDEAHCISQWGHDFRPDYARLGQFREWLGGVQTVALTATATPRVRQDIVQVLGLKQMSQFMSGFARPNLHFGVVTCQSDRDKEQELKEFLRADGESGIIYVATRKRCESLVEWIGKDLKMSVGGYHAGLLPEQRQAIQERFMSNQLRLIVATNAFGMGIDKPDLRFVLHYNMPGSLEAYYQEAGRAGRDGRDSACVLLYSFQDRYIQEFFIENNYPPRQMIQSVYEFLIEREEDPIELTLEEIRDQLGLNTSPEAVGSCLQILARTQVIERLESGAGMAMVRINSNLPTLVDMLPSDAKVRRSVMRLLEKVVDKRRFEEVFFHPLWLVQQSGMDREALSRQLKLLNELPDVDYVPPFRGRAVHFRRQNVPFEELNIDFDNLRKRKEAELERLNRVIQYAQSTQCRQANILNYFGDAQAEDCQQCDRCRGQLGQAVSLYKIATTRAAAAGAIATQVDAGEVGLPQSRTANSQAAKPPGKPESKTPLAARSSPASQPAQMSLEQQVLMLQRIVDEIGRLQGRMGRLLIVQYLCGSENSKVQKLNLHRLGGFGMLRGLRQEEGVKLVDCLLGCGVLQQQEVSRYRPTVCVAPEMADSARRRELLVQVQLPAALASKLARLFGKSNTPAAQAPNVPSPPAQPVVSPARPTVATDDNQLGNTPDWQWTVQLFRAGWTWSAVQAIRRMNDEQLAASLCDSIRAGQRLERGWVSVADSDVRTPGQQRVLREMQRRASAGV